MLLRGEFVRRFPNALISSCAAVPAPVGSPASAVRMPDLAQRVEPSFSGSVGGDCLFVGFPFTAEHALGSDGGLGVYIIFQEHPAALRFGLNEPNAPAAFGTLPDRWRALDWSATVRNTHEYDAITYLDTGSRSPLTGASLPDTQLGGAPHSWGFSSAHMAHATMHTPNIVAVHATTMLAS